MTPKYLSIKKLRQILRDAGIYVPIKTKREDIINLGLNYDIITKNESLAERSEIRTRKNIIKYTLECRGCELRDDSKLCNEYILNDIGDPEIIADIMSEMKFFCTYTKYNSIRDNLYKEAKKNYQEYRKEYYVFGHIPFRDFWNPQYASEKAKKEALKLWIKEIGGIENAILYPELPPTLYDFIVKNSQMIQGKIDKIIINELLYNIELNLKKILE